MEALPLLDVHDLTVEFATRQGVVRAVEHVDLSVRRGEILGIVGESGSGKSVTSYAVMRILDRAGRIAEGSVTFSGMDLRNLPESDMRDLRGREISMVFQNPRAALNPIRKIGRQIEDVLLRHGQTTRADARAKAIAMLDRVRIARPEERYDAYPFELSGGMCQRVVIAIALACRPDILIADEPTTALDVTVQAQIFDLLRDLQRERGTAILLITHDMGAVAEMADRVMVMYAGRVIEQGNTAQVLRQAGHPYTRGLINCLPELGSSIHNERTDLAEIAGMVPSIWELSKGCAFRERCTQAMDICAHDVPPMFNMADSSPSAPHMTACWLQADQAPARGHAA